MTLPNDRQYSDISELKDVSDFGKNQISESDSVNILNAQTVALAGGHDTGESYRSVGGQGNRYSSKVMVNYDIDKKIQARGHDDYYNYQNQGHLNPTAISSVQIRPSLLSPTKHELNLDVLGKGGVHASQQEQTLQPQTLLEHHSVGDAASSFHAVQKSVEAAEFDDYAVKQQSKSQMAGPVMPIKKYSLQQEREAESARDAAVAAAVEMYEIPPLPPAHSESKA